ncbi:ParA family protein [Lentzea sp. HUAS TT2]|uniref:Cellulose biosynthesis protein BcsQ n=4 Tax=Lentzea TaxID=165301 RepID=A0A1W2E3R6_9PSEU|nr:MULTISPECIES: ParA family protein [Lentzea]MDX8145230.1 ParA family protein [Lentzea sp. BCCO 10_0061]WUD24474.1 ParA family protein [Lentzea sp. NBC_00516]SDL75600.1 Cellulose biosynthesis protein BcsQ [Lentzea albidocapillata subsp. violacea]SFR21101.1 Cellulose biosynthesis protein BcsQ [Lentzea waywayandensis]SMD04390.1 Cellulose biosynthesis protein BcsQ [Lentzea albidocapillata]
MHTVSVLSLKGGVGKTTVVLGLASAALRRGVRTLVIDLDPQCNATSTLEPEESKASIYDVLQDPSEENVEQAIRPSRWGDGIDVLSGSEDAELLNHPDPNESRLHRLKDALRTLRDMYDEFPYQLVLLDCPPSLGQLTRSALVAADRALLVTEPTMFAVAGVQRAFEAVQNERESNNADLQPLGVVVNRVRPRSHEHQFRIEELRDIFGPLVMPVALPDRLAVQQAQGACMPIHEWGTPGAREVALAFNLLLARIQRISRSRRRAVHHDFDDDEIQEAVDA